MQALESMIKTILLLLTTAFLLTCKTTKEVSLSIADLDNKPIEVVQINDLVTKKSTYHGKWVETEGYYSFGFEKSELSYDLALTLDGNLKFRVYNAIWVEFHHSHPYYFRHPDSINHKFVRVRGYFDTTKTGHLGSYSSEITNTYLMQILKNDSN